MDGRPISENEDPSSERLKTVSTIKPHGSWIKRAANEKK